MSTDHEKLITDIKRAIAEADGQPVDGLDGHMLEVLYGAMARAAFAVFEKAHTPTDDERGVLIDTLVMTRLSDYAGTDMGVIRQAADAILAAGFRRTVQGEPTGCSNPDCPLKRSHSGPCAPKGWQGEPTDAQVKAFEDEWYRLDGVTEPERHRRALRAALRAAGVVQGESTMANDTDLIAWHTEQIETLRPFTRSSAHRKAAMMHAATVRALRAAGVVSVQDDDDRIARAIAALSWTPDHDGDDPDRVQDDYMRRAQSADEALAILTNQDRKGAF